MDGEPKGFYKFKKDLLEGVNVINKNQFEKSNLVKSSSLKKTHHIQTILPRIF